MKICCFPFLIIFFPISLFCATYRFGHPLLTTQTRYFEFVYPEESQKTAQYLVSIADSLFLDVATKLQYTNSERIIVTITPDTDLFNGMCSPIPYTHIILFDTPMSAEWTTYDNPTKELFHHEMVHAVSLNIRTSLQDTINHISGFVLPQGLLEPMFMIEGVTVSFESMNGFGRANDPLIQEVIRQDIIENQFKSPLQAAGSYDIYPYGNVYYLYGGLFSQYLQNKYGMQRYARIWKLIASDINFKPNDNQYGYFGKIIEAVYGIPLQKLWADFRNSMTVLNVEDNPELITNKKYGIQSMVLASNKIIAIDHFGRKIISIDTETGREEKLLESDTLADHLSLSPDGSTLLISTYEMQKNLYRYQVLYFDMKKKSLLNRKLPGVRQAAFFENGIIAVRPNTHRTDIIRVQDGKTEVLLKGTEDTLLEYPTALDDHRIALLVTRKGESRIGIFDLANRELTTVKPKGLDRIYPRGISVWNGKIFFSWNGDHTFYKLGTLDEDHFELQTNNYSGGVFLPVANQETVYYKGSFSDGDCFMKISKNSQPSGISLPVLKERIDISPEENTNIFAAKPYNGIKYFNPFKLWAPYPTLAVPGGKYDIDSINIISYMVDPIEENIVIGQLGYNYRKMFVNASLQWNYTGGFPFDAYFSVMDKMNFSMSRLYYYRESSASLNLLYRLYLTPLFKNFTFSAGAGWYGFAAEQPDKTSYTWDYSSRTTILSGSIGYSSLNRTQNFMNYRGFSFSSSFDYTIDSELYKTEIAITFAFDGFPIILNLFGAYCPENILTMDSFNVEFGGNHYPVFREYQNTLLGTIFYSFGDIKTTLADLELQNGLSFWFFNRFFIASGYRAAYLEGYYFQSIYLNLNLTSSILPLTIIGELPVTLSLEGYYRINRNDFGLNFLYSLSF